MTITLIEATQIAEDLRFPAIYKRENIEFALNYKPLDTDKFLVTYSKCGTTWAQKIICLILNNGIPHETDDKSMFESYLDFNGPDFVNDTVIKTHFPFEFMPYNKFAKYLCVFRNPKDCCVSFYHHMKAWDIYKLEVDFHDFFKIFMKGELHYGDYFSHTLKLWSHRLDDNFTFLVYEHMKNNTRDAVLKIAQFLGEEFVIKLKDNNESILDKVIENSSVGSMKSQLKDYYQSTIVRKGIVGDWKNHFNKAESDLVDDRVRELFTGTGLEELWAEDMKW